MSMCRVFSSVVGRRCFLWPVHSLGKTLLTFALLHSVLQGQICLLLQVSLDFALLHSSPKICPEFCKILKFNFEIKLFIWIYFVNFHSKILFETLHSNGYIFPFLLCLLLLFSQLFVRPRQTTVLPFCISFSWGWSWSLSPVQYHKPPSIVLQVLSVHI